jgi:hypothetical protein
MLPLKEVVELVGIVLKGLSFSLISFFRGRTRRSYSRPKPSPWFTMFLSSFCLPTVWAPTKLVPVTPSFPARSFSSHSRSVPCPVRRLLFSWCATDFLLPLVSGGQAKFTVCFGSCGTSCESVTLDFKTKSNDHSICAQKLSLHTYHTKNRYRIINVNIYYLLPNNVFTKD